MKVIKFFCLFTYVCIFLNITGCEQEPPKDNTPIASIIVMGNHANSQSFDVQLDTAIQKTYSSFGNIGIVIVDGIPTLLRDDSPTGILGSYNSEYLKKSKKVCKDSNTFWSNNYLAPQTKKITDALKTYYADDPEVDTLSALCTAEKSLNTIGDSLGTAIEKEIIIIDTGVSTSGALNFLNPEYQELLTYNGKLWEDETMSSKVTSLIDQLDKQAELPNLEGIRVTWYGLGQVSSPQQPLSKLGIQNLQYIWETLLTKAGCLSSTEAGNSGEHNIFIPISSSGSIECDQYVTPIPWEVPPEPEIPEQKVFFRSNLPEYLLSDEETENLLLPYVSALSNCSDKMILLVGTTSGWNGGSLELSAARAEKVKKSMIKLGVPENCISTIGLGYNLSICQDDSPAGEFEEFIGKENRSVLILPYSSPKAQEILSQNEGDHQ